MLHLASRRFFLPVVAWTPTLKSHRPKGNIKNLVICLLSTAPFALMLGRFWHLPGVFFELRVSQTVHITPVAHFSYTGLNEGRNNLRCGFVWLLELWNRDNFGIKGSEMVLCIKSCLVLWLLQSSSLFFVKSWSPAVLLHTHPFCWVFKAALKCIYYLKQIKSVALIQEVVPLGGDWLFLPS